MKISALAFTLVLTACSTAKLDEGKSVSLNPAEVTAACKSLGVVTGKGGGAFGGMISDEDLMKYATNDLLNKAAKLGATNVILNGANSGGGLTHTTTGTASGTAYHCPKK